MDILEGPKVWFGTWQTFPVICGLLTIRSMEQNSAIPQHGDKKKRKHRHETAETASKEAKPVKQASSLTLVDQCDPGVKRSKPIHENTTSKVEEVAGITASVASSSGKTRVIKPASLWNFKVDYNDHFETPRVAYADIVPFLRALSSQIGKKDAELSIYDPYWCEGSMVAHLNSLGYTSVINRNRDFYADIKKKAVPDYDILVTNPPYSGEHKVSLLSFLASYAPRPSQQAIPAGSHAPAAVPAGTGATSGQVTSLAASGGGVRLGSAPGKGESRPFALLLPVYVATKSYWKDFAQQQASAGKRVFYILPPDYYEYSHPEGTGKDIPPFYSAWFVGGMTAECRSRVIQGLQQDPRRVQAGGSTTAVRAGVRKLSFTSLQVAESVEALVQRGLVVDAKRPNPKQRQKMKMQSQSKGK